MNDCKSKIAEILHLIRITQNLSKKTISRFTENLQCIQVILNNFTDRVDLIEITHKNLLKEIYLILEDCNKNILIYSKQSKLERFVSGKKTKKKIYKFLSLLRQKIAILEHGAQATIYAPMWSAAKVDESRETELLKQKQNDINIIANNMKFDITWNHLFGEQTFVVSWEEFTNALRSEIEFNEREENLLISILDNSFTGSVTRTKFSEFIKSFGPLSECMSNVIKIVSTPWFQGYMTAEESQKYLETEEVGTFLVRFSNSKGGAFALDYVRLAEMNQAQPLYGPMLTTNVRKSYEHAVESNSDYGSFFARKIVSSVLIESVGIGFKLKENYTDKLFKTLQEVLNHYKNVLVQPFVSNLANEPWFHGNINTDEAEELLRGQLPGTFLIRFSSQIGCFATSFVDYEGNVCKSLIKRVLGGFTFESSSDKRVFPTIRTLVEEFMNNKLFVYPHISALKSRIPGSTNSSFLSTRKSLSSSSCMGYSTTDSHNNSYSPPGSQNLSGSTEYYINSTSTSVLSSPRRSRIQRRDVQMWSVEDVSAWLNNIQLSQLIEIFQENEINGVALLDLTELDMRTELDIVLGHRKQLLKAIQRFV